MSLVWVERVSARRVPSPDQAKPSTGRPSVNRVSWHLHHADRAYEALAE
jgi:hypothetical protein